MNLDRLLATLSAAPEVDVWSLGAVERRRLSLGVKDRQAGGPHAPIDLAESCAARYLLVWADGKVSKGSWERRQIERDPAGAVAAARLHAYEDPDAAHVAEPAPVPEVALFDPAAAAMASGDTALLAGRLSEIRRLVADAGFATWSGSFSSTLSRSRVVTSAGVDVVERATATGWHVSFEGELSDGHTSRAPEAPSAFSARLERAARLVRRLTGPSSETPAGDVPVLLHPNVVEEYVLGTLLDNLDGASVAHGESAFRREQFGSGAAVLREDVVLTVDPLRPLHAGAYRVSGEGVPARPAAFVEGGRLVTPVLDLKYGRRLKLPPTAFPYAMDTVSFFGARKVSLAQALEGSVLLVLHVLGVHTQDPVSGDFSLSAPQSLRVEGGEARGRVRATLSGNLFRILRREDTEFVDFEGETTPGLLVRCSVA
ncbi:MAG TPA: metallopeptidase TldD-related protein [Candidatus Polarisedimenticolaceae bacterium]|nr:metallopeptidase TldD-related protein [Candidatus Polarisedimenticolaceae bacterium]